MKRIKSLWSKIVKYFKSSFISTYVPYKMEHAETAVLRNESSQNKTRKKSVSRRNKLKKKVLKKKK